MCLWFMNENLGPWLRVAPPCARRWAWSWGLETKPRAHLGVHPLPPPAGEDPS